MALNLGKLVISFLSERPEEKLTARQIAEWIVATYPAECREKQQRSKATVTPLETQASLVNQIVAEIGSQRPRLQKKYPQIKTTEGRPRKYYFTEKSDADEIESAEIPERPDCVAPGREVSIKEADLYPLLSAFLCSEFGIYSKRIDEKRSSNARGPGG